LSFSANSFDSNEEQFRPLKIQISRNKESCTVEAKN
jgi:hypothetical protein